MVTALEGSEWSAARPGSTLLPGKDPVPIVQEAGWTPGPVWTGGKSRPPGSDPRTVQSAVSRYTDWATRPTPGKRGLTQIYKEGIRSAFIMLETERTKFSSTEIVYPWIMALGSNVLMGMLGNVCH